MTVTGMSGTLTRTAPLNLLVNSPGDFSIAPSPATLTITRGGASGQVVVTLTPSGGFVGVVNFTVSGLPARVSGNFSPLSVTSSGSTTLSLTAGTSAVVGTRTITITGTSGTLVHATTVALTVQ